MGRFGWSDILLLFSGIIGVIGVKDLLCKCVQFLIHTNPKSASWIHGKNGGNAFGFIEFFPNRIPALMDAFLLDFGSHHVREMVVQHGYHHVSFNAIISAVVSGRRPARIS